MDGGLEEAQQFFRVVALHGVLRAFVVGEVAEVLFAVIIGAALAGERLAGQCLPVFADGGGESFAQVEYPRLAVLPADRAFKAGVGEFVEDDFVAVACRVVEGEAAFGKRLRG